MITFKVGIMGTGYISEKVAEVVSDMDGIELYGIASRDLEKANVFADKFEIENRFGSYEDLANDPNVELIYIATPTGLHAEHAKLCLNAGKPCLVEGAFADSKAAAEEVFALAEEKKLFCGEAVPSHYNPLYGKLQYDLLHGAIGIICGCTATLGFNYLDRPHATSIELGGGASLEFSSVLLHSLALLVGNKVRGLTAVGGKLETGVDGFAAMNFVLAGEKQPAISVATMASVGSRLDNKITIYGSRGYVVLENPLNPTEFRFYNNNGEVAAYFEQPKDVPGDIESMFRDTRNSVIKGELESRFATHAETLRVLDVCDTFRSSLKITDK